MGMDKSGEITKYKIVRVLTPVVEPARVAGMPWLQNAGYGSNYSINIVVVNRCDTDPT